MVLEVGTCNVDVPVAPDDSVMLVGVRLVFNPAGETETAMLTVPVNPLILDREMVDVAIPPCVTIMLFGLAAMLKSEETTMKVAVTLCIRLPLDAVAVTPQVPVV